MKNINYYKKNISKTKITILGCGKSGIAAANLGNYLGAEIFISDSNDSPDTIEKMRDFDYDPVFILKKYWIQT